MLRKVILVALGTALLTLSAKVNLPLVVSVRDNGRGVLDEIRAHMFDAFVTNKPTGTGLGLALVAKIINDHGGIIECDSERRRTVFRVLLPMQDRREDKPEPARVAARMESGAVVGFSQGLATPCTPILQRLANDLRGLAARRNISISMIANNAHCRVSADPVTVDRMFSRLLVAVAGHAKPDELLQTTLDLSGSDVILSVPMPKALAHLGEAELLDPAFSPSGDWPDAPALVKAVDSLAMQLVQTEMSPAAAMSLWLSTGDAPVGFTVDQECELKAVDASRAVVRYTRHPLDGEEIPKHIEVGKVPTRLALSWAESVSFVLTDALAIKKIAFLDGAVDDFSAKGDRADDRFDADVAIATGELRKLLPALLDALGGEAVVA